MAEGQVAVEQAAELRAYVLAGRPQTWAHGYPTAVRERVVAYAVARRAAGATHGAIAAELGVSRHSVVAWSAAGHKRVGLRPVELIVNGGPLPRALPGTRVASSGHAPLLLISPKGFRVEGLGVAELAELLLAVG